MHSAAPASEQGALPFPRAHAGLAILPSIANPHAKRRARRLAHTACHPHLPVVLRTRRVFAGNPAETSGRPVQNRVLQGFQGADPPGPALAEHGRSVRASPAAPPLHSSAAPKYYLAVDFR